MKRLFLVLALVLIAGTIQAQTAQTYYNLSLSAAGVTTTAINTRGFDRYVELPSDTKNYLYKTVTILFSKTTDSVRIQGKRDSVASGVSPWENILVPYKKLAASLPGAGGYGGIRDTAAYWLTPVTGGIADYTGLNPGRTGMINLPPGYSLYRIVTGVNDSGVTYIRGTLIPAR